MAQVIEYLPITALEDLNLNTSTARKKEKTKLLPIPLILTPKAE
jgi:hypothetical protein